MSKQLYIHKLTQLRDGCLEDHMDTEVEALEAAISALSADGDCISRRVAMDAIEEMQMPIMRSEFPEEQFVFTGMSEALSAIKELPSAQPEIIRCGECNRYEKANGYHPDQCNLDKGLIVVTEDSFCSWGERRTDG